MAKYLPASLTVLLLLLLLLLISAVAPVAAALPPDHVDASDSSAADADAEFAGVSGARGDGRVVSISFAGAG